METTLFVLLCGIAYVLGWVFAIWLFSKILRK